VIHTDQAQFPSDANRIFVGTIDPITGALSGFASAVYSDGFAGKCNLISSSATHFLCYDGAGIRRYTTTKNSPNLAFVDTTAVAVPATGVCGAHCFGGTFAWDGMFYYFANTGSIPSSLQYTAFTAAGALNGTYTAADGAGSINSVYFDWSVGRYATHDGFGTRVGTTHYGWAGGANDDTQAYSAVSGAHFVP
jgi:hypothetical protein